MGKISTLTRSILLVYIGVTFLSFRSHSYLNLDSFHDPDTSGSYHLVSLESHNDPSTLQLHKSVHNHSHVRAYNQISPESSLRDVEFHDSISDANVSANQDRPKLYLHIGIPKTGTTTIQHHLQQDEHDGILRKYNMTYFDCPSLQSMYHPIKGKDLKNWRKFKKCLRKARKKDGGGMDAIFSKEVFGHLLGSVKDSIHHLNNLKQVTQEWDVIIVISYRRLFEWIPSYYYQEQTTQSYDSPVSFVDWYKGRLGPPDGADRSYFKRIWGVHLGMMHPTRVLIRKFEKHFDTIVIHNMHEEPNHLVNHFYEQILGLKEISQQRRNWPEERHVSKNIGYLNEFLLAYAGEKYKLYPASVTRLKANRVAHSIFSSQNKTATNSLPLICLTPKYRKQLLEASLRFEENLFPKWFHSNQGKETHIKKFANAEGRNKFCSLNLEVAVTSKDSLAIFSHLKESINVTQNMDEEMKLVHVGDLVQYTSLSEDGQPKNQTGEIIKKEIATDRPLLTIQFSNREIKVFGSNRDDLSKLSVIGFHHQNFHSKVPYVLKR